jgi:outer membrane protein assembly factor BamB
MVNLLFRMALSRGTPNVIFRFLFSLLFLEFFFLGFLFSPPAFGNEVAGPEYPLVRWQVKTGGPIRSGPAAGRDGTVVFGSDDGVLRAVTSAGEPRWELDLNTPIQSAPAVAPDGTVFVGAEDRRLYAAGPDGRIRWAAEFDAPVRTRPALTADGGVVVSAGDVLAALDLDGTPRWQWGADRKVLSDPVVLSDGRIAVGAGGGYLLVHESDGSPKIARQVGLKMVSRPAVGPEGNLFVGTGRNELLSLTPEGIRNWVAGTGNHMVGPPALGSDGIVVAGSDNRYVFARSPTGDRRWAVQTGDWVTTRPVVDANGRVFAGSWDGSLYAIDPEGKVSWRFETGGPIEADPLLTPDETLLIPSHDGILHALGGPSERPLVVVETRNRADGSLVSDVELALTSAAAADQTDVTGPTGTAAFWLEPGAWKVRGEKEGFSPHASELRVKAEDSRHVVPLAPVGALRIPESSLPPGTADAEYQYRFPLSGGTAPYVFSIVGGEAPEGLVLDSAEGTLNGTPTETGAFEMMVSVTDANGLAARREFSLEVEGELILITEEPLPEAMVGHPYEFELEAEGALPPIRFFPAGEAALPAGLKLSEKGRLAGTPETAGEAAVSVKIQSRNQEIEAELALSVAERLRVTTDFLPDAVAGQPYEAEIEAAGGAGERTVRLAGNLPPGLRWGKNGIQGTPDQPGMGMVEVYVSDEAEWEAFKTFPIWTVEPLRLGADPMPEAVVGAEYRETVPISGGMPPYTLEILDPLPEGLAFEAETGEIAGTPTEAIWTNVRVRAGDASAPEQKLEGVLGVRVEGLP